MRNLKPFFFENSKLPKFLSYFAPIDIGAISLFGFVFSQKEMSERTKRHETIHFQQQLETLMIGFLFVYLWDYFRNRIVKKMNGRDAYYALKAEKEAYFWDNDLDYLPTKRKRWAWLTTDWEQDASFTEEETDSVEDENEKPNV